MEEQDRIKVEKIREDEEERARIEKYSAEKERLESNNKKENDKYNKLIEQWNQDASGSLADYIERNPGFAQTENTTETISMSFYDCIEARNRTIASLGVSWLDIITIVDSSTINITRICTSKSSVLVTCNMHSETMIITQSPAHDDVGCI